MNQEPSYHQYYERALSGSEMGIKLVVGGTGLGKTSSIIDVVAQHPERQFVYVAHRRRLLSEMEKRASQMLPYGAYVRVHRDVDQVRQIIQTSNIDTLLQSEFAVLASRKSPPWLQQERVVRAVGRIRRLNDSDLSSGDIYELLEDEARLVMRFFRYVVQVADGALNQNETIQALFPFMRFRYREETNFALVTLHKLFYGLFDGQSDIDISALAGCVVFLDEFDFLEQNLLELLCRTPEIDNLFEFVAPFYRVMSSRLPYAGYAQDHQPLKGRLQAITDKVSELHTRGFDFPRYTQCFLKPGIHLHEKGIQIFRTNQTLTAAHLRIWQGEQGFEIAPAQEVDQANTSSLSFVLGALHNITRRVLTLFKEYKQNNPSLYDELRWQCYGQTRSQYYSLIEQIGQFPRSELPAHTGFDSLLGSGFNLYDIENLGQLLDPDAVEIRSLALYSTPERMLCDLAQKNLVFGLSATADIERHLHHFDLHWLREQEGVHWLPVTQEDRDLVQSINVIKQQRRDNRLYVHQIPPLHDTKLRRVIETLTREPDFADRRPSIYHKNRVEYFFAILEWLKNNPPSDVPLLDSHLIFVSSYRQLQQLFINSEFRQVPGIYHITPGEHSVSNLVVYQLQYGQRSYKVLFLDSERGERILENEHTRQQYDHLFDGVEPVMIITQYASAGAGVNLQYRLQIDTSDEQEYDFSHVYLLDLPFYFFGDDEQAIAVARKKNIWQLAKLYHSKQIGRSQFLALLGETRGSNLSQAYISGHRTRNDALMNRLAVLIQALGRVERSWQHMPDQHVLVVPDVLDIFQRYVSDEEFDHIRASREKINSANLAMLLTEIDKLTLGLHRQARQSADRALPTLDQVCQEKLTTLLDCLALLREGHDEHHVRATWEDLRRAALRHDFQYKPEGEDLPLLSKYCMVHPTPFIAYGSVYLDSEGCLLDPELQVGKRWWLDAVYDVIRDNETVSEYFQAHGYEMGFIGSASMIFTPYAYQSVLEGAVGEAAVIALIEASFGYSTLEPVPDQLYELVDLKFAGPPIFLDVKNYSETTQMRFGLEPLDPDWHPKLNSDRFAHSAVSKLAKIQEIYGSEGRLIYINLVASDDRTGLEMFNRDFEVVQQLSTADIVVVKGALQRDTPNQLTHGIQALFDYLMEDKE